MRNFVPDAASCTRVRNRRPAGTDLYASGERDPPTPLQIFTRLGVLLLITLGFGLAVQFLASVSP
jgi:hypothetical protein